MSNRTSCQAVLSTLLAAFALATTGCAAGLGSADAGSPSSAAGDMGPSVTIVVGACDSCEDAARVSRDLARTFPADVEVKTAAAGSTGITVIDRDGTVRHVASTFGDAEENALVDRVADLVAMGTSSSRSRIASR